MQSIICHRCGSVDDYYTVPSGPHLKAICNGCGRYIKFISKSLTAPAPVTGHNMSTLYNGSICLSDIPKEKITTSERNGKKYLNVNVWVNDDEDQYGNIASVSVSQSKAEREAKAKRVYIGNLKLPQAQAQTTPAAPAQPAPADDLPF